MANNAYKNIYDDETLKKSKNEGDQKNYQLILQHQNAYKNAEKTGDTKGMEDAHRQAELVRMAYGYSNDKQPVNNAYTNIPTTPSTPAPASTPNAYWGMNTYNKVQEMQNQGYNAYKDLVKENVKASEMSLNRNRRGIEQNYENAYTALKKENEAAMKQLPEQMAKLGLYGSGSGETAVANIKADFSNQLRSLMQSKNNALYDLDGQIEAVKQQGTQQLAQYYAELMQKQPDLFLSMLEKQQAEQQYNDNIAYRDKRDAITDERWQMEWDKGLESEEYNRKFQEAQVAASYGNYQPSVALGLNSPEQAKFNEAQYMLNRTQTSSGGSSGRSSGGSSGSSENKEMKKFDTDNGVLSWLFSINGFDDGTVFYQGWNDNTNPVYAAKDKLGNTEAINAMIAKLLDGGYTLSQARARIEEYKDIVAEEIRKAEKEAGNKNVTTTEVQSRYKSLQGKDFLG